MTAGRNINTLSQSWGTPLKYINAVREVFNGVIHLDPCSNRFSLVNAETEFVLPGQDGLEERWDFPTIYVNPPYGIDKLRGTSIKHWFAKCADAYATYGSQVLALVPVAVNTTHWKRHVFTKARSVCFLYDTRLRFLEDGKDTGKGAPMACAMVYWGDEPGRFYEVFINHGAVLELTSLHGELIGKERLEPTLFR